MDNIPIDNTTRVDAELAAAGPLPRTEEEFTKWVGAPSFVEAVKVTLRTSIENGHQIESMFYRSKELGRKVQEMEKDFEWLEAEARKSRTGISFDYVPACEGEPKGFRFMRHHHLGEPSKTIREAIATTRGDAI